MSHRAERIAAAAGRFVGKLIKLLIGLIDDLLLLAGGGCILYGLSLWSTIITWIVAGVMLIGLAVLVGKAKARNVDQ